MSLFIPDAAIVGLKEALKLVTVWFVLKAYLRNISLEGLMRPFYAGLALTTLLFGISFVLTPGIEAQALLAKLVGYVFFLFIMLSLAVLYIERTFSIQRKPSGGILVQACVLLATVIYFSPDTISSSLYIREIAGMQMSYSGAYLSGAVPFIGTLAAVFVLLRGSGDALGKYLGLGQLLLVLVLIKLLGGGSGGFGELSLIPSVQRGAMKLIHDTVHQIFVFTLVPDHPVLSTDVWKYVGMLFGSNFGLAAALVIMLTPPLWYLYSVFTSALPEPGGVANPAERRMFRAEARRGLVRRALPVVVFTLVVIVFWYVDIGGNVSRLYLPQPKPVVVDKGLIIIPLTDPTMDLMDGQLHKFSLTEDGQTYNLLAIRKPDGKLAVCLDACEICPPEGYGLSEDHVVCVYCMTPIPVDTLGKTGGCNPIPLKPEITDTQIRLDFEQIRRKWRDVQSGTAREDIR